MEFFVGKSGAEGRRRGRKVAVVGTVIGFGMILAAGRDNQTLGIIGMLAIPASLIAGWLITFIYQD